ncbi:MAG: 7-cyano-7-deazaguanine synthase QueC [Streptococcaceae bacterium]|jgi:7-cyano-7-deazaguanine synthase|nr:7-cyano-7-deazaguanine synthase QueC [Streptococcaceae bacterium]
MKALILSSGGNDSTSILSKAVTDYGTKEVATVSIYYGQRHDKEIESARKIADYYGLAHYEFDLSKIYQYSNSAMLKQGEAIKESSYAEQLEETKGEVPVNTYVPFRNGLFLSIVTALAIEIEASEVWYGAHADDAAGNAYPDCSIEFVDAMAAAIKEGTGGQVVLSAPVVDKNKSEVVAIGLENHAPLWLTWSCYKGEDKQCGLCGTCRDRIEAFKQQHVIDPVPYAIDIDWTDCEELSYENI